MREEEEGRHGFKCSDLDVKSVNTEVWGSVLKDPMRRS
jgi:hypothetical protein